MIENQDTLLITLGINRSGFSALGGCLGLLGGNLGISLNEILPAYHELFLRNIGSRWDMVGNLPKGWQVSESALEFSRRLKTALKCEQEQIEHSFLKALIAPRLSRIMPLWGKVLDEYGVQPKVVILVRHPVEVALSLRKHYGLNLRKAFLLWYVTNRAALIDCKDIPYTLLTYDQLLANPVQCMDDLSRDTGLKWPRPIQTAYPELLNAVQPSLKNHHAGDALPELVDSVPFVQFYDRLLAHKTQRQINILSAHPDQQISKVLTPTAPSVPRQKPKDDLSTSLLGNTISHQNDTILDSLLYLITPLEQTSNDLGLREKRLLVEQNQKDVIYAEIIFSQGDDSDVNVHKSSHKFFLTADEWYKISLDIPDVSILRQGLMSFIPLNTTGIVKISSMRLINNATGIQLWSADANAGFEGCDCRGDLLVVSKNDGLIMVVLGPGHKKVVLPDIQGILDVPLCFEVWIKASKHLGKISEFCILPIFDNIKPKICGKDNLKREWDIDSKVLSETLRRYHSEILLGLSDIKLKGDYANILLCAQPKSASLYFTELISRCFKFKNHQISFNKAGGLIYYPRLIAAKLMQCNTISHCHAEPDKNTINLIKQLNLYPIVLTRNLLDSLVSRRDMLLRGFKVLPRNFLTQKGFDKFLKGDDEYQIDITIELFASAYINFFVAWKEFMDTNIKPAYVTYEQLVRDEVSVVLKIAETINIDVSEKNIKNISSLIQKSGGINFSTGAIGRGKQLFTEKNLDKVRYKAKLFGCNNENYLGFKL